MIVIDYYNFLYSRYPEINEPIIFHTLKLLSYFVKDKNTSIIIVFDGIYFKNINFSHKQIKLYFSSQMTADDYIINIFSKLQGKSHIIVSKDRKLVLFIKKKSNATVISPDLFWKDLDFLSQYCNFNNKKSKLIKMSNDSNTDVDSLFYIYYNENNEST
jgi:predicted RNA-binding protein with PIN domain